MTTFIGLVSQKGGVGKSMICRLLAVEYARIGWRVLIADMDTSQSTSYEWNLRREEHKVKPAITVERFTTVEQALELDPKYDLIVFDGAPHANRATEEIAKACNLIILPTGGSLEDLIPQIRLAHELHEQGIDKKRLALVLSRIGNSQAELEEVLAYLQGASYAIIKGFIPEKTVFRQAIREGKVLTETRYKSLTEKCEQIAQAIANKISEL